MSEEYMRWRLAEIDKMPKREVRKRLRKSENKFKPWMGVAQERKIAREQLLELPDVEFDMICYGDDRYEEAVQRFLDWLDTPHISYLYIAHDKDRTGPVKIGYTKKPDNRLSTLNTSYPGKLTWLLLFPFPGDCAYAAEQQIQKLLKKYKISGKREWFKREGLVEMVNPMMEVILKNNPHARVREYYDWFGEPVDFEYDFDTNTENWHWTVDVGQWEGEDDGDACNV